MFDWNKFNTLSQSHLPRTDTETFYIVFIDSFSGESLCTWTGLCHSWMEARKTSLQKGKRPRNSRKAARRCCQALNTCIICLLRELWYLKISFFSEYAEWQIQHEIWSFFSLSLSHSLHVQEYHVHVTIVQFTIKLR